VVVRPGVREAELFCPLPASARFAPRVLGKEQNSNPERE
jgi:hypothetical protein